MSFRFHQYYPIIGLRLLRQHHQNPKNPNSPDSSHSRRRQHRPTNNTSIFCVCHHSISTESSIGGRDGHSQTTIVQSSIFTEAAIDPVTQSQMTIPISDQITIHQLSAMMQKIRQRQISVILADENCMAITWIHHQRIHHCQQFRQSPYCDTHPPNHPRLHPNTLTIKPTPTQGSPAGTAFIGEYTVNLPSTHPETSGAS